MSASDFARMKDMERRIMELESAIKVLTQLIDSVAMQSKTTLSLKKAS